MSFRRFLASQCWLWLLFLALNLLLGQRTGPLANLALNALTFVPVAWWLGRALRGQPYPLLNVLSATLSFNAVTYLILNYGLRVPLPAAAALGKDFALVTALSLAGGLAGLAFPRA